MIRTRRFHALGATLAIAMLVAACSSPGATTRPSTAATPRPATLAPATLAPATPAPATSEPTGDYHIGYSNAAGVGNGFREEQVCTARAEALASEQVSELTVIHHVVDAVGQLADLRTLIAANVDAIVFNPNDADALTAALDEAEAAEIPTVSVDAYVNHEGTYNLYNNQVDYAYLGAKWLFEELDGTGTVWYMRGLAGNPADNDRHIGFNLAREEFPDIEVVPSDDGVATGWDPAVATQVATDFISAGNYDSVDGIWTSGMDSMVVDAIKAANKPFVPIVGADLGAFVAQLLDETEYPGLTGAAVTNTAAVGGAGVNLALKLLNGEDIATDPAASQPNTVLLVPVVATNTTDDGKALLASWQVEGLDPNWPLGLEIAGWTSYTPEEAIACKGPGE